MTKLHHYIASMGYAAFLGFVDACLINLHNMFAQAPRIILSDLSILIRSPRKIY